MLGSLPAGPVQVDAWMRVPHTHSPSCTRHSWLVQNHSSNWWSELGLQGRRESEGENVLHFSRVRFFAPPWTVACQAPLSWGFSRQEYWSGLPFPSLGDLPNLGIKPGGGTLSAALETTKPNQCDAACVCSVASVMSDSLRPYGL